MHSLDNTEQGEGVEAQKISSVPTIFVCDCSFAIIIGVGQFFLGGWGGGGGGES